MIVIAAVTVGLVVYARHRRAMRLVLAAKEAERQAQADVEGTVQHVAAGGKCALKLAAPTFAPAGRRSCLVAPTIKGAQCGILPNNNNMVIIIIMI